MLSGSKPRKEREKRQDWAEREVELLMQSYWILFLTLQGVLKLGAVQISH